MKILSYIFFICLCPYLSFAQTLETVVQRGHNASVKSVTFTTDGKYIISVSRDKTAKLWEVETGREIRTFLGHNHTVNGIVLDKNGKGFLTSSADKTVKLWDISSQKPTRSFEVSTEMLSSLALSPNGKLMAAGGFERVVKVIEVKTGKVIQEIKTTPDQNHGISLKFSPDGKWLAIGNSSWTVNLYKTENWEKVSEIKPANSACSGCSNMVDFSPDSRFLLTETGNDSFQMWEVSSNKLLLTKTLDDLVALKFSPDGKTIMGAGKDSVKIWNIDGSLLGKTFKPPHELPLTDAVYSPDGKYIATSSDDKSIIVWNLTLNKQEKVLQSYVNLSSTGGLDYDPNSRWDYYIKKYTGLKNEVRISPDGQYLLKGKIGNIARMWELGSGKIKQEFRGHEKAVMCFEFTKDGRKLVTGGADNKSILWDVASGKRLMTFEGHREIIFDIALSPDEKRVLTGSWDGTAKIWDIGSGKLLQTFVFKNNAPYTVDFYGNGLYIMVAGLGKKLEMWEVDSKKKVRGFVGHNDIVQSLDFHPAEKEMTSVGWDGFVKVWDIGTGLLKMKLEGHKGAVNSIKYDKSGQYVATGGSDMSVRIWDCHSGNEVKKMEGHYGAVTSLNFSPNNKYLISGSDDGMLKVWDWKSGKELFTHILIGESDWMVLDSDGYFNATGGARQSIVFVKGMESYGPDQFFEEFYRPRLLSDIFNKKAEKDNSQGLLNKLKSSPPPSIEIISPRTGEPQRQREMEVLVKVTNQGGGIDEIKVLHNGKRIPSAGMDKSVNIPKGKSIFKAYKIKLVSESNTVSVSAFSKGRIESKASTVSVAYGDEIKRSPSLYILAIGVNKYENPELDLNYAKADAEGFIKIMDKKTNKLFEKVVVNTVLDTEATKENIFKKLDAIALDVKTQDVFCFYFAGHGSMVNDKFYFVTTNNVRLYSEDRLKKKAIYAGELQEKLKHIKALKQLVIVDACQSGGAVELLAKRGAAEEKALAQLSRSAGVHVLSAAGSEQFAIEFKELGHGLFTHVLLEALGGKADGVPKDGKVTVYELKSYLDNLVPEYSQKYKGKIQYPYTFSRGHDFPIVME